MKVNIERSFISIENDIFRENNIKEICAIEHIELLGNIKLTIELFSNT